MRVVAIKPGFLGGLLRKPGDEFEAPDEDVKASNWMIPAETIGPETTQKPRRRAPRKTSPQTTEK